MVSVNLKAFLKHNKLSEKKLGDKTGYSQQRINGYLNGVKIPFEFISAFKREFPQDFGSVFGSLDGVQDSRSASSSHSSKDSEPLPGQSEGGFKTALERAERKIYGLEERLDEARKAHASLADRWGTAVERVEQLVLNLSPTGRKPPA